jgi:hypothetical protein
MHVNKNVAQLNGRGLGILIHLVTLETGSWTKKQWI